MANLLIYHSNPVQAQKLCDSLKKEQYHAIVCDENDLSLPWLNEENAPLILLDASMKWTVCRPLLERFSQRGCPILFFTSDRRMSAHLRALYSGECDVLVAPYTQKALKTKVHSLAGSSSAPRALHMDETERVAHLDGRRVELTAQEFALLSVLLEKPDVPVSREQLLRQAWGYQSMGETRTVDVHIQRLRKKLGVECIETVYKCGYRLRLA